MLQTIKFEWEVNEFIKCENCYEYLKRESKKNWVVNATAEKKHEIFFLFLFQRKFNSDWAKTFKIA